MYPWEATIQLYSITFLFKTLQFLHLSLRVKDKVLKWTASSYARLPVFDLIYNFLFFSLLQEHCHPLILKHNNHVLLRAINLMEYFCSKFQAHSLILGLWSEVSFLLRLFWDFLFKIVSLPNILSYFHSHCLSPAPPQHITYF